MLVMIVHAILLLPSDLSIPYFDAVCDLLPGLDKLSRLSSAVEVLDQQEVTWPKNGNEVFEDCFL